MIVHGHGNEAYAQYSNDKMWSLKEGLAIWLWKSNNEGWPKLPSGVSKLVPFPPIWGNDVTKVVEKQNFIIATISKYLEFWNLNMSKNLKYADIMNLHWLLGSYFRDVGKPFSITMSSVVGRLLVNHQLEG
jgi:hypothetical protein